MLKKAYCQDELGMDSHVGKATRLADLLSKHLSQDIEEDGDNPPAEKDIRETHFL